MKTILFVYGTVGGNTQLVVEAVAGLLAEHGFKTKIQPAEATKPEDLLDSDAVILASPTYGHGFLESTMAKFVASLAGLSLKGKPAAAIGLGDPKYELQYHLESAPLLEKALVGLGGKILIPALRISRTPVMHLKGLIPNWVDQFVKAYKP